MIAIRTVLLSGLVVQKAPAEVIVSFRLLNDIRTNTNLWTLDTHPNRFPYGTD